MKALFLHSIFAVTVCLLTNVPQTQAAQTGMNDRAVLQELRQMIEKQQAQIDRQAAEIQDLKSRLVPRQGTAEEEIATDSRKAQKEEIPPAVQSADTGAKVVFYGQVNRAGLWADNGDSSNLYFVDNDNSSSRLGINATASYKKLTIGGKIEYQLESNSSNLVSSRDENPNNDLSIRHVDASISADNFGKFSFGRGSSATEGISEMDLSGTHVVSQSAVYDMAGGQLFYDDAQNILTSTAVGDVFTNMDGLSRLDRFRYDTPVLAGITVSAGINEDDAYDLATRYSRDYGGVKVSAGLGWVNIDDSPTYDNQYSGSVSILHDSGFNLSLAGGLRQAKQSGRDDPSFWYTKLGYILNAFSVGSSAFSVDYFMGEDIAANDDEASSMALAYVQNFDDWGTELYLAYRFHQLDRDGTDFNDISAVMSGARVKF